MSATVKEPIFICPDCGLPFDALKEYLDHLSYLAKEYHYELEA